MLPCFQVYCMVRLRTYCQSLYLRLYGFSCYILYIECALTHNEWTLDISAQTNFSTPFADFPLLDYVDHLLPLEQPPYVLKQFKCSPLFFDFLYIYIYIFHDFYFILFFVSSFKTISISSTNPTLALFIVNWLPCARLLWYPYPDTLILMVWYF